MPKQLNRLSLYEMVWNKPVTKVAADLGISDVALHKVCRKHDIPVPPRGHWAKLAAGKRVEQTPLPRKSDNGDGRIEIMGRSTRNFPESVLQAQKHAKSQESAEGCSHSPESCAVTSPFIERLRKKLMSARPNKDGYNRISAKHQFNVTVTPDTSERATVTLERIIGVALSRGYKLTPSDCGLALMIHGELITLTITEMTKRVPHSRTTAESARMERWERSYNQKIRRGVWASTWDKPAIPEFDEIPSGLLLIEIDQSRNWDGLRRKFRDGKRQRVENLAETIVTAGVTCAAAAIERRKEAERREREYQEMRERRQELERQRVLEEKRWEFLESRIHKLKKAQDLRQFVANYRAEYASEGISEPCQRMLNWASDQANLLLAEIDPDHLAAILEKHDLMNNDARINSWVRVDN